MNSFSHFGNRTLEEIYNDFVLTWLFPLLSMIGLSGNILCLVIIQKYPVFSQSTKSWFVTLLITDILILLFLATDFYLHVIFPNKFQKFLNTLGALGCEIRLTLFQSLSWLANILQSTLSIERTYSVLQPMKAKILFTKTRAKVMILILVLISVVGGVLMNGITFRRSPINNESSCKRINGTIVNMEIGIFIYYIDLIFFRAIPFAIMFVSSCLIIAGLKGCNMGQNRYNLCYKNSNSKKEFRMFILLISMNFMTLLTNPLFFIFELIDGLGSENREYGLWTKNKDVSNLLKLIFNFCMYLNNQFNWVFYIATGSKFRRYSICIFRKIFRCHTGPNNGSVRPSRKGHSNFSYGFSLTTQSRKSKNDICMTTVD